MLVLAIREVVALAEAVQEVASRSSSSRSSSYKSSYRSRSSSSSGGSLGTGMNMLIMFGVGGFLLYMFIKYLNDLNSSSWQVLR